jgi:hypothetical protein
MEADDQVATYGDDQFGLLSDTESYFICFID